MVFHIERVLGHRIDDNYPLSLFLRASKELITYYEEQNESNGNSTSPATLPATFGG